jgi:cytochrome c-type biogenesis protein CcmH
MIRKRSKSRVELSAASQSAREPESGGKLPHSKAACGRRSSEAQIRRSGHQFRAAMSLLAAMVFVCAGASAQQLTEAQAARAKSLSLKVKCMCGGCNDPAGACFHSGGSFSGPCDMARSEIKLIDQKVAGGESDDQILKDFVAQYGPTVLVDPPKSGFNLTAWIMPVLVPIVGLFGVWEVARRWRQKHPGAALASASTSGIPPEMIARVQHDIERDEP